MCVQGLCGARLTEHSWVFPPPAFSLLQCIPWAEVYEENLASHRCAVGKKTSIFIRFFQIIMVIVL